jgi:hypothetical protein
MSFWNFVDRNVKLESLKKVRANMRSAQFVELCLQLSDRGLLSGEDFWEALALVDSKPAPPEN